MQFIDLQAQYQLIKNSLNQRIQKVLDHGFYIGGSEIDELEKKLAEFVGIKHCIAVSNGSDAILVALMALGIGPGDEVITTPFSFIASSSMIAFLGAKPVFVDIQPDTFTIDPKKIEAAITPKTKAILPVSLFGQCADMDAINAIAEKYNLTVIEDAAQSLGATYKGRQSCNLSKLSCTSFFPAKPLGAYGDAGACFTNDDELSAIMRQIMNHGQSQRYYHQRLGINGRLDTLQAAILLSKFEIFSDEINARHKNARSYTALLQKYVQTPVVKDGNTSVYAQYTILVPNRDHVSQKLKGLGIPTAIHYPVPIHLQPVFASLGYVRGDFPVAERSADQVMSLPMDAYLTEEKIRLIAGKVIQCITEKHSMAHSN